MIKLFLDDERTPRSSGWTIVRSYESFVAWVRANGLPDAVSFDHDLGEGPSGHDCAKFIVDYCLEHDLAPPPFSCHSGNPVGKDNILSLLSGFAAFRKNEENTIHNSPPPAPSAARFSKQAGPA